MPTTRHENRPSAGIAKTHVFFAISNMFARPFAGIGVVEVQKPIYLFFRFLRCSRDPLRGSACSRCKNPWLFCDFCGARATLSGDRRGRGAKTHGFLRFLSCSRNPLNRHGRGAKTHGFFCDFCCSNWSSGVVSWFARLLPEPAGRGFDSSLVRGRASQDATCILKQLVQSNLRRASCTEQLAQTNLHRPVCAERLA